MENPAEKITAINSLLSAFPVSGSGSAQDQLRAYLIATELYVIGDVREAVRLLIAGLIPEHDGRYAPTAPQLARACRKVLDDRLDHERLVRKPALPPPDIIKTPESRERVRQKAQAVIAQLAELSRTDDAKKAHERKRWQDRQDARFMPPQDEQSLRERLHIGDPDGERDVA